MKKEQVKWGLFTVSCFCWLLFLIEIFYLRQRGYSFRGHTEVIITYVAIIVGFISFKKQFFIGMTLFIIVLLIPMTIPFFMFIHFLQIPASIALDSSIRLEQKIIVGQYPENVVLYQAKNFWMEEKILEQTIEDFEPPIFEMIEAVFLKDGILILQTKDNRQQQIDMRVE